jgi:hypothetical protein
MDDTENDTLNDDWITKFENNDKLYHDFYKENLYYTNLFFIYVNKDFEIEKIKQDTFFMSIPNCITKSEILGIIKKASEENNIHYRLLSLLKYNINLESEDIYYFLKNSNKFDFFSNIKNIDAVCFDKSINMFHDLNDLILIMSEKNKSITHNKTKRKVSDKKNYTRRV